MRYLDTPYPTLRDTTPPDVVGLAEVFARAIRYGATVALADGSVAKASAATPVLTTLAARYPAWFVTGAHHGGAPLVGYLRGLVRTYAEMGWVTAHSNAAVPFDGARRDHDPFHTPMPRMAGTQAWLIAVVEEALAAHALDYEDEEGRWVTGVIASTESR